MSWINKGKFCFNSFLIDLDIPHAVSTRNMGDLKNPEIFTEFIEILKQENLFKNCNLNKKHIFLGQQKHTANYFEIKKNKLFDTSNLIQNNDGFYSKISNIGMGVYTADCMPVFVVIPNKKLGALLHSGWKGVALDITGKCISEIISKYTVKIDDIFIVIGPHLKSCCYEVGEEFKQKFDVEERTVIGKKKYFLDMQQNFFIKMKSLGISENNIKLSNFCTGCTKDISSGERLFYSYRFDNATDTRMMSVLVNK